MSAPIDFACPTCKTTAGNYCIELRATPGLGIGIHSLLGYHHAERVDFAMRELARRVRTSQGQSSAPTGLIGRWVTFPGPDRDQPFQVVAVSYQQDSENYNAGYVLLVATVDGQVNERFVAGPLLIVPAPEAAKQ